MYDKEEGLHCVKCNILYDVSLRSVDTHLRRERIGQRRKSKRPIQALVALTGAIWPTSMLFVHLSLS